MQSGALITLFEECLTFDVIQERHSPKVPKLVRIRLTKLRRELVVFSCQSAIFWTRAAVGVCGNRENGHVYAGVCEEFQANGGSPW